MAIYSVFDWSSGNYAVYQDARPVPLMSDPESCPVPQANSRIGYDISSILCTLPSDARFVGWSQVAKGQVVRLRAGKMGVPSENGGRYGSPNLGGLSGAVPIMMPDGGMGFAPGLGQVEKFTFGQAVLLNTLIGIASTLLTTLVFKKAFTSTPKKAGER